MKKRILCFGDSNTWGYIPENATRYDESVRWTCQLEKMLGDGWVVIEEGMTGRTTVFDTGFDDDLNGKKALPYILKSQLPLDAVVIMLGTNDLCERHMDRIELGITELVRLIKNADSIYRTKMPIFTKEPRILLVSPLPYGKKCALSDEIKKESELYPSVYKRVAEKCGVDYLDPSLYIVPSSVDGIHFTPEAHKEMSKLIFRKIMEMKL